MLNVSILALRNAMASTVTVPLDFLQQAGLIWNYLRGESANEPFFKAKLVTPDGQPVRCLGQVMLVPHGAVHDNDTPDLIVIGSVFDIDKVRRHNAPVLEWLKTHYARGAALASICTGAFLLGETGLLDGKAATTHWGYAREFARRYPKVRLQPDRLVTDEARLICSGGVSAGIDLCLYLVEKYGGREMAVQVSKAVVHELDRGSQLPYAVLTFRKDHADGPIRRIQAEIEGDCARPLRYDELARRHGMSRRSFERRFKAATGDTPLIYLQRVRVEAAKRLLESPGLSVEQISYQVGYEDSGFFRRLFQQHTGIAPREYRQKYGKPGRCQMAA